MATANRGRARPKMPGSGRPKGSATGPHPSPMDMPTAMRLLRVAQGLTLDQAGQIIGISGSHLRKIEVGQSHLYATDAVKLAKAYGVSVEQLIAGPGEVARLVNA